MQKASKKKVTKATGSRKPSGKERKATSSATTLSKANQPQREARESKKATVLGLLRRGEGATLAQIAEATGWQNHSIRGFISATAKKLALPIESTKNESGDRVYRTTA